MISRWQSVLNLKTITLVGIVVLPLAYRFTPLYEVLGTPSEVRALLEGYGVLEPVWFVPMTLPLILLGCPRLLICTLAGVLHGLWFGVLLSQVATLLGAYGIFAVARAVKVRVPVRVEKALDRYGLRARGRGIAAVFFVRQLPLPGFLMNVGLGSIHVSTPHFLLGSLLGFLPLGVPAVAVGAGMLHPDRTEAWGMLGIAIGALIAVAAVVRYWRAKRLRAEPKSPR